MAKAQKVNDQIANGILEDDGCPVMADEFFVKFSLRPRAEKDICHKISVINITAVGMSAGSVFPL